MGKRHQVIPAVHLLLIKDGKVLLLRRFNTGYEDGNYSVPAGHIDPTEHAVKAMIRESNEEIGIKVEEDSLVMVHVMNRMKDGEERIDFFFQVNKWSGEPFIAETDKCDQLIWVSLDQLPDNTIDYIKFAIGKVKDNQVYSYHGF